MDLTVKDAYEYLKSRGLNDCNLYMYEKQIDLHIWTLYSDSTFEGYEVHYLDNQLPKWTVFPWKRECEIIRELIFDRSRSIE